MSKELRYCLAALLGAAILVALAAPQSLWVNLPDLCAFHQVFHRPCPTCGLTRSWSALLHGNLAASFRYHALGPATLVGLAVFLALPVRPWRWVLWLLALVWIAYSVARMTGFFPADFHPAP